MNGLVPTNRFIIHPKVCEQISRGFYMGGEIRAMDRATCKCGNRFQKVDEFNYSIPKCLRCNSYPHRFVVRRNIPIDGKSKVKRIDIRHTKQREPIKTPWEAVAVIQSIDYELKAGTFDPRDYGSKEQAAKFTFGHFMDHEYLPAEKKRMDRGELSPSMYRKKLAYRKHLAPLDSIDIRILSSGDVKRFYNSWTDRLRTRDLVTQELKTALNFALGMDKLLRLPSFPKTRQAKSKSAQNFLTPELQKKIISNIENDVYRAMVEILSLYAMRPGEVRALKWRDLDFKKGIITVQRHFSGSKLVEGRKSNKEAHYLPMVDEFYKIINRFPVSLVKDNFIFIGKNGKAVGERVLARAWHSARERAKMPYVQLYEGTKHSRLSYLKNMGHSDEELILLSGHTNIKTVQRYAKLKNEQRVEKVKRLLD